MRKKLQNKKVSVDAVNEVAREFEKYITTLESIRSHNKYEQAFFSTLRSTRKAYEDCKNAFNSQPW